MLNRLKLLAMLRLLIICFPFLLLAGCTGPKLPFAGKKEVAVSADYNPDGTEKWIRVGIEPMRKPGHHLHLYKDLEGRKKELYTNDKNNVYWEVISYQGVNLSDQGWYDNGRKQHRMIFSKGKLYSLTTWHPNGYLKEYWHCKDGYMQNSQSFNENGTLRYQGTYRDGVSTSQTYYSDNGQLDPNFTH